MHAIRPHALLAIVAAIAWSPADASPASATPLLTREPRPGGPLFESLPESSTGVSKSNSFQDPRCWGALFREFNNGSLGTGVAIGDFDGDGRPDIAAAAKTGSVTLYRNLGGFRFEDVTNRAGLAIPEAASSGILGWFNSAVGAQEDASQPWTQGVVFADIDNDGRLDLYVCRFGAANLLFMNRGDGTFSEEAAARGLAIVDASVVGAFCDFDRDGWLDVYVQTNILDHQTGPDGQRDHLLRNKGAGFFEDVSERLTPRIPSQGHSCAWWDFDDDGWPDLYVANDFAAPDMLYHNKGGGTFVDVAAMVLPATPYSSMGCDTGDIDGDGLIDLFVADMAATSHEKDQRSMAVARYLTPAPGSNEAPQISRNMLFLGTGSAQVHEAACMAGVSATDWTWSPRFEDFDCDGRIDLLVTNGMNREHHNVELLDRINRTTSPDQRIATIRDSPVLAERNLAFRNDGSLHFTEVGARWGFDELGVSFGSATGDLDGDGDLDIIVARYDQPPAVYRNLGGEGECIVVRLKGTQANRFGIGAKVRLVNSAGTQVREIWTARGYQSSSEPAAFFGLRPDGEPVRIEIAWPGGLKEAWDHLRTGFSYELSEGSGTRLDDRSRPPETVFRRIESDMTVDAAAPAAPAASPTLKSPRLQPRELSRLGPGLAVVDLDRDGREELILGGDGRTPMRRVGPDLRMVPIDGSRESTATGSAPEDGPLFVFDADGDGHDDILATRTGETQRTRPADYALRLLIGNGTGTFAVAPQGMIPEQPICAGAIAAADFDRDGALEVFIGSRVEPGKYPASGDSMLLQAQGGTWIDACARVAPGLAQVGMVTGALWSDVDDDGWIDLVVACEWGRVRCFFNTRAGQLREDPDRDPFARFGSGWWTALAAADINRDGRPDYIAGNAGLNTHYRADATHPALLLQLSTGRSRGATALLEAYFEDGRRVPWRTRRDLGTAWPAILRKFPSNDRFATATVEDLFDLDTLDAGSTWTAQELRSGVFMSGPEGRFTFQPLPAIGQIAPIHGIEAGDLDGDGLADVCVLQNSSGQASGSWFGGLGQLFRGRGTGELEPVPPSVSGFVVPGEGRALAVFDPDGIGRPVLAAMQSREPPRFFTSRAGASDQFTMLRLRQTGRNPNAFGARIEIAWSDGGVSAAEIQGGGGYMTQPSTAVFIGLGGTATPTGLKVRWPDGSETRHGAPPGSGRVILDRDSGYVNGG